MELSIQQEAIIDFCISGTGSANVVARAGCGKTSTGMAAIEALVHGSGQGNIFFGAYNKPIAVELQDKIKSMGIDWKQARAATFHSAGFSAWRKLAPNVKVNSNKMRDLLDATIAELKETSKSESARIESYQPFILRAVSIGKQQAAGFLFPIDDLGKWYRFVDHYGLDGDLDGWQTVEEGIALTIRFLRESIEMNHEEIDFDDMIFAPLYHNARIWPHDWVFIDEAQDTNPARRALALKMLKPKTGRMLMIGDPAQAIYGFTGADADAMNLIQKELGSITLPLNQTYRCPKAVVEMAQRWVSDIEATDEAPEGSVQTIWLPEQDLEDQAMGFYDMAKVGLLHPQNDVVLCRNVKPLIDLAFGLIARSVGCQVEGREIGTGLLKIVNRFKAPALDDFVHEVDTWRDVQIQKWLAKGKEEKAEQIDDQAGTLIAV
ncbi:MAG: ATP-dependent helicase, partial [Planctomycetes bacterium]|nr:ATP-dependent helicase [Planctomycetota bacterium]